MSRAREVEVGRIVADLRAFSQAGGAGFWRRAQPPLETLSTCPLVRSRLDEALGADALPTAIETAIEDAVDARLPSPDREAALDHLGFSAQGRRRRAQGEREQLAARHWGWRGETSYRRRMRDRILLRVAEAIVAVAPDATPAQSPASAPPPPPSRRSTLGEQQAVLARLASNWRRMLAAVDGDDMRSTLAATIERLLSDRELASEPSIAVARKRIELGDALAVLGDPRPDVAGPSDPARDWATGPWHRVPAGAFPIGSDPRDDPDAFENEQPAGVVVLHADCHLARFPVTVGQFRCFVQAPDGYARRENWRHGRRGASARRAELLAEMSAAPANHPVTGVTWFEAASYCVWLTRRVRSEPDCLPELLPGEPRSTLVMRLPSEHEWEKAARGVSGLRRPWSDELHTPFLLERRVSRRAPTAVGLFVDERSPYGCVDLVGNVWEWCDGAYASSTPLSGGLVAPTPPGAPAALVPVKGGGCGPDTRMLRSACRFGVPPERHAPDRGFRVAATLS